jgi:FkbM family methyltransferase
MRPKLATLSVLESIAGLARRLGLGSLVDRLAPLVGRPFERFELDVDGVRLAGTELAHLHYVRELMEKGREQTFVRLLREAIPPAGVVLEGGAHLGFVTVHAAQAAGPTGRVIAFEANATVLDVLHANLSANGVAERVEIVPKALGDGAGRTRFYVSGGGEMSSLFAPPVESVAVDVEIVRADDAVSGPVDVVKLDIEGGELAALRGMEGLIDSARPPHALFLECNPESLQRAGTSAEALFAWLAGHGYDVEWIDESRGRTVSLTEPWTDAYVNLRCRRVA